jgi:hypothetical protein
MKLVTRVQIRVPFDGKMISHETRFSDTIDNVKAKIDNVKVKIDNVKAKTRDEEEDPCQDPHWQDVMFPTSWTSDQFPIGGTPSDKSPPRTTGLRLARQAPASAPDPD